MMTRSSQDIEKEIISFFKEEFGIDVGESSQFFIDTGIDGDDGFRFVQTFQNKFNVDMSSFDFNTYFLSEEAILKPNILVFILSPFIFLYYSIFGNSKKKVGKYFKISHFISVVKKGKWFNPE